MNIFSPGYVEEFLRCVVLAERVLIGEIELVLLLQLQEAGSLVVPGTLQLPALPIHVNREEGLQLLHVSLPSCLHEEFMKGSSVLKRF